MSKEDIDFLREINDKLEGYDANLNSFNPTSIARCLGRNVKTVWHAINIGEKDFFTDGVLEESYNRLNSSSDPYKNRLAEEVNKHRKEKLENQRANIDRKLQALPKMIAANSVMMILSAQSTIDTYLPILLSKRSSIKNLKIVVYCEEVVNTITAIEEWAYGSTEGYSRPIDISLFEREDEPIAEIFGGFIDSELVVCVNQQGYTEISPSEKQELMLVEKQLSNEQPIWSLPHSPEARFIERLRRELKDDLDLDLPPDLKLSPEWLEEVLDFLDHKAEYYESAGLAVKDQERSPLILLHNALILELHAELKAKFGDGVAEEIANIVNGNISWITINNL